ncbi:MAG: hypothetical protein ACFB6R_04035 [Alphaproteobacteria bacterium]
MIIALTPEDGDTFYFPPKPYNAAIAAGETDGFGFQATFTQTQAQPPWDADDVTLVLPDEVFRF